MKKYQVGDVVYLKVTFEEGVVTEIISEQDYFILWSTGDRGIFNESALLAFPGSAIPEAYSGLSN